MLSSLSVSAQGLRVAREIPPRSTKTAQTRRFCPVERGGLLDLTVTLRASGNSADLGSTVHCVYSVQSTVTAFTRLSAIKRLSFISSLN